MALLATAYPLQKAQRKENHQSPLTASPYDTPKTPTDTKKQRKEM